MKTEQFYDVVDTALVELIARYKSDPFIKRHHKNEENKKAYAFLIWFLEQYHGVANYKDFITDGNDDHSFDLVIDWSDQFNKRIFYVVQSKWNSQSNCRKDIDKNEVLRFLQEAETALSGEMPDANDAVKEQLARLKEHRRNNGEVRFIFLALCNNGIQKQIEGNVQTFLKNNPHTRFNIFDIEHLRLDYIDKYYKQITPHRLFRSYYNPEEEMVQLEVERLTTGQGTFIKVESPFPSYIFLVRPRMLHELFSKYDFQLFHKNVRNPLLESSFNKDIEQTALNNPSFFWYYNNGITAIAGSLPTAIANEAVRFEVAGLQIINGAQTVYSLYRAYESASLPRRAIMDANILVTLRIIASANDPVNLEITRYTNSQNPVEERDFWANDEVQIRLQNESFNTNNWYEKRRGEFREVPKGVRVHNSSLLAMAYTAFYLQNPHWVTSSLFVTNSLANGLYFISHKKDPNGLYERVFHEDIRFVDLLASGYFVSIVYNSAPGGNNPEIEVLHKAQYPKPEDFFKSSVPFAIALSKTILKRYLELKYKTEYSDSALMEKLLELRTENKILLAKIYDFAAILINRDVEQNLGGKVDRLFNDATYYPMLVESFKRASFSLSDVDNIQLLDIQLQALSNLD